MNSFIYALIDLELSKMTLRDLGQPANICYQQHQFLIRGLGDMSSDGRTDRHNGDSIGA
jgi:hypothetical protein